MKAVVNSAQPASAVWCGHVPMPEDAVDRGRLVGEELLGPGPKDALERGARDAGMSLVVHHDSRDVAGLCSGR